MARETLHQSEKLAAMLFQNDECWKERRSDLLTFEQHCSIHLLLAGCGLYCRTCLRHALFLRRIPLGVGDSRNETFQARWLHGRLVELLRVDLRLRQHELHSRQPDIGNVGTVSSGLCCVALERLPRVLDSVMVVLRLRPLRQPSASHDQQPRPVLYPCRLLHQCARLRNHAEHEWFGTRIELCCLVGMGQPDWLQQRWVGFPRGNVEWSIRSRNPRLCLTSCVRA